MHLIIGIKPVRNVPMNVCLAARMHENETTLVGGKIYDHRKIHQFISADWMGVCRSNDD